MLALSHLRYNNRQAPWPGVMAVTLSGSEMFQSHIHSPCEDQGFLENSNHRRLRADLLQQVATYMVPDMVF